MSLFLKILGVLILIAGLAVSWSPIPLGIVLIPVGLGLLVATSQSVRNWLKRRRENNPGLDRWLRKSEDKVPERLSEPLRRTDADNANQQEP
ncbi:MAG: hypothetical protein ACQRW7_12780 [Caulobacterales bacterium]|uniref:hypothetical protein n=1 Tax=Glycocaulis sp. TaxID=1969725 RepID=UPI003FA15C81